MRGVVFTAKNCKDNIMEAANFKYYAFISYSHKDKDIAMKLQKRLERYHLPSTLQKSNPDLPKKLRPVFIDESDLVAKGTLKAALQDNLNRSNYLIVICSPNSAKSEYVNDEVEYFINSGRTDYIIPLIVDGMPHSDDGATECFPPAILELPRENELLGIDIKKFGMRDAFLRVIAAMLRLDLDKFVSREARERKKRAMIFTPLVLASAIFAGMFVWYNLDRQAVIFAPIAAVLAVAAGVLVWRNYDFFRELLSNASAQKDIADSYRRKENYAKAAEWYRKAASNGDSEAQCILGRMYQQGEGVGQDYAQAVRWYQKSAEQGNSEAEYTLGSMYQQGEGVRQDESLAVKWYETAAGHGNTDAKCDLGRIQLRLGSMYDTGSEDASDWVQAGLICAYKIDGTEQDYDKAAEWYSKSAAQGNPTSLYYLGEMYEEGHGLEQDYGQAMASYKEAAEKGKDIVHSFAVHRMGWLYYCGHGAEQDYFKAAEMGCCEAQNHLGEMYLNGDGVSQGYTQARKWFETAADDDLWHNDAQAQYNLGIIYRDGLGVPEDSEKAIEWLRKAAEKGHEEAKIQLQLLSANDAKEASS